MNKELSIIENKEDIQMLQQVLEFMKKTDGAVSFIQVENFILNKVEYPTDYGVFEQAKVELKHRYNQLIDSYYQIRKVEVSIKIDEERIEKEESPSKKELIEIDIELSIIKLEQLKNEVKKLVKEARIFFSFYKENEKIDSLSDKEKFDLEVENWTKKTINMPIIFEERYGKSYMIKVLGEENYKNYLEMRTTQSLEVYKTTLWAMAWNVVTVFL